MIQPRIRVARSFLCVFCRSLFVPWAIALSVLLQFTASNNPFRFSKILHDFLWIYYPFLTASAVFFNGVKPLTHQSELRTYATVVPFKEKKNFLSLCSIVKNIEWNGILVIKIDN